MSQETEQHAGLCFCLLSSGSCILFVMSANLHDSRESYCRMLGHEVPFHYCRQVADGLPCRLVPDCWHARFDAAAWLREHYTPEQIARITAPPKPKIASLLELIERARNGGK